MTTEEITLYGRGFTVPVPDQYSAGNTITLTAGEAKAFGQLFCKNIQNNMTAKMRSSAENGVLPEALIEQWQPQVNEYALTYEFGVRKGGRGRASTYDPETLEALNLIKPEIRKALVAKYGAKHGHTAEQVNTAALAVLSRPSGEKFKRLAKQIVRQKQEAAEDLLAGIDQEEDKKEAAE